MLKFLGTGAGEGTPDPFCTCRVCENARRVGGKEIRERSFFMADDILLDPGNDYFSQCAKYGLRMSDFRNILISHTHSDHFCPNMIWERFAARAGLENELNICLSREALRFFEERYPIIGDRAWLNGINLKVLEAGQCYEIGTWKVTPLRGRHSTGFERNSFNYILEKPGMKLYYALDSGYYLDDTFEALENAKLDVLIMECTNPIIDHRVSGKNDGHMDYFTALECLDELYKRGAITASTRVYFTHISPNTYTHAEFSAHLETLTLPYRIEAAYDGMEI